MESSRASRSITTSKGITILGATGSIGTSTLDVISRHPDKYHIVALTANTQTELLFKQCSEFEPKFAVMVDELCAEQLEKKLKKVGIETTVLAGKTALEEVAALQEVDYVMAAIVGVVIIGGIKRIGSVTEKVVPFMAAIYVGTALIIIFMNVTLIPEAFGLIFEGAFSSNAALGGIIGVLIVGFQRAAFSNEAGVGSAAIAHSAVKTKYPASEGIVALLEPLIDTVLICTMTALVLIITNIEGGFINYGESTVGGIELTGSAFDLALPGSSWILMFAAVLFAISTMLSWSYYGLQAWKFLFGKGKALDIVYKVIFLIFIVIGSSISLGAVIDFSDAMIFAMVFPNVIGLILLSPKVREELKTYQDKIKAFKASK